MTHPAARDKCTCADEVHCQGILHHSLTLRCARGGYVNPAAVFVKRWPRYFVQAALT